MYRFHLEDVHPKGAKRLLDREQLLRSTVVEYLDHFSGAWVEGKTNSYQSNEMSHPFGKWYDELLIFSKMELEHILSQLSRRVSQNIVNLIPGEGLS